MKEFIIFVVLSMFGLLINEFILWICVEFYNIHFMQAKIISTTIVMIWNFVTKKIFWESN